MQRLLKQAGHAVPATKPILEINPSHPLIERLQTETDSERAKELGLMLLDQAQLLEGVALEDPAAYVRRVNALLVSRYSPARWLSTISASRWSNCNLG